jgi:hypothetical protein
LLLTGNEPGQLGCEFAQFGLIHVRREWRSAVRSPVPDRQSKHKNQDEQ